MFRLHGSPISNYYNIVKLSLMEKGLDFEEIPQRPSQDEDFLAKSPLGKIPVLEVREGFITETVVILDFLEDVYPEIPLFPADPFEKALVRRLCHMTDIYIDAPARPLLAAMFRGVPVSPERKDEIRAALERGATGLARVATPSPYLHGSNFTAADIFLYYCLSLITPVVKDQLGMDIYSYLPDFDLWRDLVAERQFVQQVDAANRAAMDAIFKQRNN